VIQRPNREWFMSGELSTKSIKFCVLRSESGLNAGELNKLFLAVAWLVKTGVEEDEKRV
jgi:hypothetical protein